jgi:hypothetical protein
MSKTSKRERGRHGRFVRATAWMVFGLAIIKSQPRSMSEGLHESPSLTLRVVIRRLYFARAKRLLAHQPVMPQFIRRMGSRG